MKTHRWKVAWGLLAVLASQAGVAFAQPAPEPPVVEKAAEPITQPIDSLPNPGEMLTLIDKATSEQTDGKGGDWSAPVKLAVVFAMLALLPSMLVMMTSFTRIIIVLSFLRRALTTQNIPPTIALIGLALFLTLFTMAPTFALINQGAIQPYLKDEVTFFAACEKGNALLKEFMYRQMEERTDDIELFLEMSGTEAPDSVEDIPGHVMIPAFAINEFRKAFTMGCLLFIPFLLVDLVISGILLSTGMMMLPPAMISLPFKIILFVLVGGWRLLAKTLVTSFH